MYICYCSCLRPSQPYAFCTCPPRPPPLCSMHHRWRQHTWFSCACGFGAGNHVWNINILRILILQKICLTFWLCAAVLECWCAVSPHGCGSGSLQGIEQGQMGEPGTWVGLLYFIAGLCMFKLVLERFFIWKKISAICKFYLKSQLWYFPKNNS